MGKSGNFDTGTGELAPRAGEFLAGVLALSRISRVTVALESGHGAGPALLAAARLTAHAETCLRFDQWRGEPLADLAAALFAAHPDLAIGPDENLAQALRTLQSRERHSFLVIFDRFDDYLAQPADRPQIAAFDRAFVQMANDSELDVHFLLVQDEAAEPLLNRFQNDIPGIGDGCLRMPAGDIGDSQDEAAALDAGRASRRDRSFGMLLERLTAIAPADAAAASPPQHIAPAPALPPDYARQTPEDSPPAHEVRPVFDGTAVNEVLPAESEPVAAAPEPSFAPLPAAGMDAPAVMPLPPAVSMAPTDPPRRGKALVALLSAVLAVGAGFYAYRQQAPDQPAATSKAAALAAAPTVAAAQARTSAAAPPSSPAPQSTPAPALAAAPPTPAVTPAAPATPVMPATPVAASQARIHGMPAVYVHVRSQRERDRMQSLARTLADQGIRVVDVKVMNMGPSVADLRYFRDQDKEAAISVQQALVSAGVDVPRLSRMNGFEGSTRPGHFEAWLSEDSVAEPVQRH